MKSPKVRQTVLGIAASSFWFIFAAVLTESYKPLLWLIGVQLALLVLSMFPGTPTLLKLEAHDYWNISVSIFLGGLLLVLFVTGMRALVGG